jgi:hypothetical protein
MFLVDVSSMEIGMCRNFLGCTAMILLLANGRRSSKLDVLCFFGAMTLMLIIRQPLTDPLHGSQVIPSRFGMSALSSARHDLTIEHNDAQDIPWF